MLGSECDLKIHVRNLGYPLFLQIGDQKPSFWRFWSLTANLTADIFGMEHGIHKRVSALKTTRGLPHRLKTTETLVHKRLEIGGEFLPTLRKFCIPLHCQASRTKISKPNFAKRWIVNRANNTCRRNVGVVLPEKMGPKTFTFVRFLDNFET